MDDIKIYGTILPSGNQPEFPELRVELRRRGVVWFERRYKEGAVIFWVNRSELPKLPSDDSPRRGPRQPPQYLGDDWSGHALSPMDRILAVNPGEDLECPEDNYMHFEDEECE